MRRVGGEQERRRLRDRAASFGESGQSGGVGGSWGASRGAAWYWGGGPLSSVDLQRRGAAAVAAGGTGRLTVPAGAGPGPFGVDVVAGRIQFLIWGGWPLVVGGLSRWSARWLVLPSHALVLLVHGELWAVG